MAKQLKLEKQGAIILQMSSIDVDIDNADGPSEPAAPKPPQEPRPSRHGRRADKDKGDSGNDINDIEPPKPQNFSTSSMFGEKKSQEDVANTSSSRQGWDVGTAKRESRRSRVQESNDIDDSSAPKKTIIGGDNQDDIMIVIPDLMYYQLT